MKNTYPSAWPSGTFTCRHTGLPAFETTKDALDYFSRWCGSGQSIERIDPCAACDGFHLHTHETDENGKRPQTRLLPAEATITGRRLSAKDAKAYADLHQ